MKNTSTTRHYKIELSVFLILLYLVNACVFLNGDDFMYGTFAHDGILKNIWHYYLTGNGRFWINILDSALLWFDRYLFILVNPLLIFAFIKLMAKNVQWILNGCSDPASEQVFTRWGMVLFACLDVMCLREAAFWITGMMNYLFPSVMFLWGLLLFQQARGGLISGKRGVLFCAVSFLTASSVEQFALMFVGMMTLILGIDLIPKKGVSRLCVTAYVLALVGLTVLLLAPGNFVRVEFQNETMPSFFDNFWTLLYQNTVSPVALPYLLMLSLCAVTLFMQKSRSVFIRMICCSIPVLTVLISSLPQFQKAILLMIPIAIFCVTTVLLVLSPCSQRPFLISLLFVGAGSQIMLLISAVWGFRCMFSLYLVYMLLILCTLARFSPEQCRFILCSGLLISLHPVVLLVYWLIHVVLALKKVSFPHSAETLVLQIGSCIALLILFAGYGSNVPVMLENQHESKFPGTSTILLKEPPAPNYSWYRLPLGDFHEPYYRQYYRLPDTFDIQYSLNSIKEN